MVQCLIVIFSLLLSGCCTVPCGEEGEVARIVEKRIGEESRSESEVISVDRAVWIGLMNLPEVQALYAEVGIARADLIEAGLMGNPKFSILVNYPFESGLVSNIEYIIAGNILDLFLVPRRKKVAELEYEQTKLWVAGEVIRIGNEVREAYYEYVAAVEKLGYLGLIGKIEGILGEIARRQEKVGNIRKLEMSEVLAGGLESEILIQRGEGEVKRLREKLIRLMGVREIGEMKFPDRLCDAIEEDYRSLAELEQVAIVERLDLMVGRMEIERLCKKYRVKEWWAYTNIEMGISGKREVDGLNMLGPEISGDVPIFNWGQGARERIRGELTRARAELMGLRNRAVSEVREKYGSLMVEAEVLKKYRERVIPMQREILEESEALYNVMGLGVDDLLRKKKRELEVRIEYVDSLKRYWVGHVELERAVGVCLREVRG